MVSAEWIWIVAKVKKSSTCLRWKGLGRNVVLNQYCKSDMTVLKETGRFCCPNSVSVIYRQSQSINTGRTLPRQVDILLMLDTSCMYIFHFVEWWPNNCSAMVAKGCGWYSLISSLLTDFSWLEFWRLRFRGEVWGEVWERSGTEGLGVTRFEDNDHDLTAESKAYHKWSLVHMGILRAHLWYPGL